MSALISGLFSHPQTNMAEVDPTTVVETVDIEDAAPPKATIRYTTESNRVRNRHVTVDYAAITPGDIGGLYAAISTAITADLNRLRRDGKGGSSKSSSFFSGSADPGTPLSANDCDLKIELCRLIDSDGTLFIPPVKDTSMFRQKHAQLQSSNTQDPRDKKYDFLAFLLDRDVKGAWEHLQDGLFFEEGEGWPWYSLLVTFSHEARLDKVVKYQGRLVMGDIDPQNFFPRIPIPPPPSPTSIPSPQMMRRQSIPVGVEILETVTVSPKPKRTKTVGEVPKAHKSEKPSRSSSHRLSSAKYADVKAKSRSAFTIGSLVKAQR